jgi:hypothetical protein
VKHAHSVRSFRRILVVLVVLVLVANPVGATTWEIQFFTQGDGGGAAHFCWDHTYLFLKRPNYVAVYLGAFGPLNWVFLGFYGQTTLPSDLPVISFPAGKDMAQATAVPCP